MKNFMKTFAILVLSLAFIQLSNAQIKKTNPQLNKNKFEVIKKTKGTIMGQIYVPAKFVKNKSEAYKMAKKLQSRLVVQMLGRQFPQGYKTVKALSKSVKPNFQVNKKGYVAFNYNFSAYMILNIPLRIKVMDLEMPGGNQVLTFLPMFRGNPKIPANTKVLKGYNFRTKVVPGVPK